jgi:hypothetical protein
MNAVKAGLRNPYTQIKSPASRRESTAIQPKKSSKPLFEPGASTSDEVSDDDSLRELPTNFDAARVTRKRIISLAQLKEIRIALRQFKNLLKPGSRLGHRLRYGIMVGNYY